MSADDRTMCTSRTLPFSPMAVYAAFASPDLLAQLHHAGCIKFSPVNTHCTFIKV